MTRKIFRSILIAVVSVLLLSFAVVTGVLYRHFSDNGHAQLRDELSLAMQGVETSGKEYLSAIDSKNYRLTWIDADGTVLYDTDISPNEMDNHGQREEIAEAFKYGIGESSRYSDTLTERTLYAAALLSDGTVLRVSTSVDSIFALLADVLVPMIFICIFAVVISIIIARRMSVGIVKPLNELDLEHPAENNSYEELSPILGKINRQHKQIASQMAQLRQKTDQFEQITASMNEGLVLLDEKNIVLSINPAAKKIFGAGDECIGQDFLTIDRTTQMNTAIKNSLSGKHNEFRAVKNGQEYQFDISRIESEGITLGAVILCFDVTEIANAERNRQEFTANVSHELKTPLQSIIGSAELIENGLVKPEDMPRFVGHIRNEATRLVTLINDIIHLSQLDENSTVIDESVDLYEVAGEAVEVLTSAALKKNVTIELCGENCIIAGVRRYLYEIVYNLCDNAIRYNIDGGKVTIDIHADDDKAVLSVADTGIGIAPEHQSRIFERFYRVDKSHSKETGGTGLGLSIVKHAVAFHGGNIEMTSVLGEGTEIRVLFTLDHGNS